MQRVTFIVPLLVFCRCPRCGRRAGTPTPSSASARDLEIFFIDVEGGQATLIVTPAGQTLLIDAGYGPRAGRAGGRTSLDATPIGSWPPRARRASPASTIC